MSSNSKGGWFEREVSRRLSLWISKGKRDDLFWRTALSGGRATLQAQKGIINVSQAGDIGAIHPDGEALFLRHVIVECKFRRDLVIVRSLICGDGALARFWEKHYKEARQTQRQPFMVARENNMPTLLLTTEAACLLLEIRAMPVLTVRGWAPRHDLRSEVHVFMFDDIVPPLKK